MKNPIALIREDTGEATFWCCAECGAFCGNDEKYAQYHCGGRPCDDCGEPCKQHYTKCEECQRKNRAERDAERIAKAEKISASEYGDPVFWDEKDEYYSDVSEAWEAIKDDFDNVEDAKAQTLWACDKMYLRLCPSDILDNALESQEHHEDARDHVSDKAYEELVRFCEAWNDAHGTSVESWFPNQKIVVIPESWLSEFTTELKEESESDVVSGRQDG